ncbi:MAG: methionine-gamma-lyase [Hyphomonadaceae bacterium]|nr:MAG: methionine-gamma-lyase [Hyphomonadaceae bacterium]
MSNYHKRTIGNHELSPETQMMGYGYDPHLSEGSLKPPIFLTSTFVFPNAQAGKDFFDYVSGRKEPPKGTQSGLVYSRFNNPNLEVLEDRLALWDKVEMAAVFSSGMSAIATTLLAFLRPGDVLLACQPLYGGTETLIDKVMANYGIANVHFHDGCNEEIANAAANQAMEKGRVGAIIVETPGNPTNALVDLQLMAKIADKIGAKQGTRPPIICDNTLLGPVYQQANLKGADISVYSLTKYVGGHSDLVAGGATGNTEWLKPVRALRSAIGTQLDPNTAWMIMRSMETMALRMERANQNAEKIANFLKTHPKVFAVHYLGFLQSGDIKKEVYDRQCLAAGSTFAFEVVGGEAAAFKVLDNLQVMKLAVSLGGTETLISHPASMTHSGVPKATRDLLGISESLIRISVGIENADDLIADLTYALSEI